MRKLILVIFSFIGNGSHVQFDIKKDHEDYTETLMEELTNIPNCQVWEKDEIPKQFQFINGNTGDYLLICRLLDISPYDGKEDFSQGDIKVLEKILIKDNKK